MQKQEPLRPRKTPLWKLHSLGSSKYSGQHQGVISNVMHSFWLQNYLIYPLQARTCSPAENECYQKLSHNNFDCRVACSGLFADIDVLKRKPSSINDIDDFDVESEEERTKIEQLLTQYKKYKTGFVENFHFELGSRYYSKLNSSKQQMVYYNDNKNSESCPLLNIEVLNMHKTNFLS